MTRISILCAILAAALFGASTPLAKLLVGDLSPILLAGLLYLGSGFGLALVRLIRDRDAKKSGLTRSEWPWLLSAILFGGVLAPIGLLFGLLHTSGATASLLLNMEAVLTALIAWVVFRENAGMRIVLGMAVIVAGGIVLSWPTEKSEASGLYGPLLVAIACLCWAIDNNLTRKVSASDALFIAGSKGLIAGTVNTLLGLSLGAVFPPANVMLWTLTLGLFGYGISLVLFILALRGLGTSRTAAYFSTAPFIGAAVAIGLLGEPAQSTFWIAAVLMACGVWLHLTEHHKHTHVHQPIEHSHSHQHDTHHQHEHGDGNNSEEMHSHLHRHVAMRHKHQHYPDIHHRHSH